MKRHESDRSINGLKVRVLKGASVANPCVVDPRFIA